MPADHYTTLGVARDASEDDIKKAYRKLVRETHPDMGGDPEAFRVVQEAWETLGDVNKRRNYDYVSAPTSNTRPKDFDFGNPFTPPAGGYSTGTGGRSYRDYAADVMAEQLRKAQEEQRRQRERIRQMEGDLEALREPAFPYVVGGVAKTLGTVYGSHRATGVPMERVSAWKRFDARFAIVVLAIFVAVNVITGIQAVNDGTWGTIFLNFFGYGIAAFFVMMAELVGTNLHRFINYSIPNRTTR